jgi:hypothetical protein
MSDDPIERLRANGLDECDEAIARIEALEARVAAADKLAEALLRIADLTQHNMGMTARDETCVYNQAQSALAALKGENDE